MRERDRTSCALARVEAMPASPTPVAATDQPSPFLLILVVPCKSYLRPTPGLSCPLRSSSYPHARPHG